MYEKIGWVDHATDPESGGVVRQGTPLNAENLNHMDDGISKAMMELERTIKRDEPMILTEGVHYGTALPAAGTKGRLFLLKV